jgi:site-specific recombinase XerC
MPPSSKGVGWHQFVTVTLLPWPVQRQRHCPASVYPRLVDKRDYPPFFGHTGDVPSRFLNDQPPVAAADARRDAGAADCASALDADTAAATPNWFSDFLIDRATRKPSAHTMKAYRQDFTAVADLLTSGCPADVALIDITKDIMRAAFAAYASTHEPASIRRCWSTWNVLCDFLYTAELIPANPMPFVGRPKAAKTLPRSLPQPAVAALLDVVDRDHESTRRTDWPERDLALILTGLLAGVRADELRRADVGDIRTGTDGGAVLHVRGKGGKDRAVPIEAELLSVIEDYLDSRASRLPATLKSSTRKGLSRWPANAPRSSLAVTANESPAAPCSHACGGPSGARAQTPSRSGAHSYTACGTPTPPSWPTPRSACTR